MFFYSEASADTEARGIGRSKYTKHHMRVYRVKLPEIQESALAWRVCLARLLFTSEHFILFTLDGICLHYRVCVCVPDDRKGSRVFVADVA